MDHVSSGRPVGRLSAKFVVQLPRMVPRQSRLPYSSTLHVALGCPIRDSRSGRARTRSWNLRVVSFAPGEGASATTFMLARVPVLPQSPNARMSSRARSKFTVRRRRFDVNGRYVMQCLAAGTPRSAVVGQSAATTKRAGAVPAEVPIRGCSGDSGTTHHADSRGAIH